MILVFSEEWKLMGALRSPLRNIPVIMPFLYIDCSIQTLDHYVEQFVLI